MIIPTIAAVSRESLRAVPRIHRESALSLGATRWEATRLGVLRPARRGIAAGIILGLGRALGETIAVAMVIGNIYILPGTLFSPGSTLASWIVNKFGDATPGIDRSAVVELALILLAITVAVNVIARGYLSRFGARDEEERPVRPRRSPLQVHHRALVVPATVPVDRPVGSSDALGDLPLLETSWRQRVAEGAPRRILRRRAVQWGVIALAAFCVFVALVPFASVIFTAVQYGGSAVVSPSFYTSLPLSPATPNRVRAAPWGGSDPRSRAR